MHAAQNSHFSEFNYRVDWDSNRGLPKQAQSVTAPCSVTSLNTVDTYRQFGTNPLPPSRDGSSGFFWNVLWTKLNLDKTYFSFSASNFPVRIYLGTFFFASNNYHDTVDARAVSLRPIQRRFKAISLPVACPHHFHSTHSWLAGNSEEWTGWLKQRQLHFWRGETWWCCVSAGFSVAAKWIRNNREDCFHLFQRSFSPYIRYVLRVSWDIPCLTYVWKFLCFETNFTVCSAYGFWISAWLTLRRHQNNIDVIQENCVMCEWCGFSSLPLSRTRTDM